MVLDAWDHQNNQGSDQMSEPCDCGTCFVSIRNAVVLVDEISAWAPSRYWAKAPLGMLANLAQVRHGGVKLLWTGQHEQQCDVALRRLTAHVWHVTETFGGLVVVARARFPMDYDDPHERPVATERTFFHRTLIEAFSSFDYAPPSGHLVKTKPGETISWADKLGQ